MNGWRINIGNDFAMGGARLTIYRRHDRQIDIIDGFDDFGVPTVSTYDEAVATGVGLLIDREVLEQIAEHFKPGPSQGEMARVVEALEVERSRVNAVLDTITRRSTP